MFERDIDLFMHAARTVRLPRPSLSLTELAGYFVAARRCTTIVDGSKRRACSTSRNRPQKRELRRELVDYNCDDLERLVDVHNAIRAPCRRNRPPGTLGP